MEPPEPVLQKRKTNYPQTSTQNFKWFCNKRVTVPYLHCPILSAVFDVTAPKSKKNSFSSVVLCDRKRLLALFSSKLIVVSSELCCCIGCASDASDVENGVFGVPNLSDNITSNDLKNRINVSIDFIFTILNW